MFDDFRTSEREAAPAVAQLSERSEREKAFLSFCQGLDRDLERGKSLQPSKSSPRVTGSAVLHGQDVDFSFDRLKEFDRSVSKERLGYIESESGEFPRISAKYRWALEEAVRRYKGFIE